MVAVYARIGLFCPHICLFLLVFFLLKTCMPTTHGLCTYPDVLPLKWGVHEGLERGNVANGR